MQIGGEGADAALCDFRVLVLVLADAIEVFDVTGAAQQLHKVLVVRDDQQLEVALTGTTLNDPVPIGDEETRCELLSLRVLCVRVCVCALTQQGRVPAIQCFLCPGWWWAHPVPGSRNSDRRSPPRQDG